MKRIISVLLIALLVCIGFLTVNASASEGTVTLDVPLYTQQTNYTCADASALMCVVYYTNHNYQIKDEMPTEDILVAYYGSASVTPIHKALKDYCGITFYTLWRSGIGSADKFADYVKLSIDNGNPLVLEVDTHDSDVPLDYKTSGHYMVVCGYSVSSSGTSLIINDPFSPDWFNSPESRKITLDVDSIYNILNYIVWAGEDFKPDFEPPRIFSDSINVGEACFNGGGDGFVVTFDAIDNTAVSDAYAYVWQFGDSEADATLFPGTVNQKSNGNFSCNINVNCSRFGIKEDEGIFYFKLYISDGHNIKEYSLNSQNDFDTINLFRIMPDDTCVATYTVIKDNCPVRCAPYEKWNNKNTKIGTLSKDRRVSVVGKYVNSYDNDWYQLEDGTMSTARQKIAAPGRN